MTVKENTPKTFETLNTIPQNEKVFSIFEPHTRLISKGKAGRPVELGVPVDIAEDHYQFILHHEIMWTGRDVDFAVPLVEITKELFPDFCAASFDRGFHSPAIRTRLDELLVDNVLPKKGSLSKADRDREQGETFAAMRRQHPAVESAINNLEHRGLDRVRSKGRKGFARTVALAVVALNVHRLGRVLRQQAREPTGIPNDDQTEQKSPIREERDAKFALTRGGTAPVCELPHQ